jgi:cell division protease FtsH
MELYTMSNFFRALFRIISKLSLILLFIILSISIIDYYYSMNSTKIQEITYTRLLQAIDQQNIDRVSITDNHLRGKLKDGQEFNVIIPTDSSSLIDTMVKKNIEIKFEQPPQPPWWSTVLGIDNGEKR